MMGVATKPSKKTTKGSTDKRLKTKKNEEEEEDLEDFPCLISHSKGVALVWGIITCIILWTLTVKMMYNIKKHKWTAYYMLLATLIVTVFELLGIISRAVPYKYGNCKTFSLVRIVDNWKKTVLYLVVALPCFLPGIVGWIAVFCGLLIVSLAGVYLLSTFKRCECLRKKKPSLPQDVHPKRPTAPRERHRPITMVDMTTPTAKLINHEVQTPSDEFTQAGAAYCRTGHTTPVQPPREDEAGYAYTKSLPSSGRATPATASPEQQWRRADLYRVPMTPAVASDPRSKTLLRLQ